MLSSHYAFAYEKTVSLPLKAKYLWDETHENISLNLHITMDNLVALALNEIYRVNFKADDRSALYKTERAVTIQPMRSNVAAVIVTNSLTRNKE